MFVLTVLFCSYLMLRITLPYFSFDYGIGFLLTKQAILHIDLWRLAFYIPISSIFFVLLLGVFQFIPFLLEKYPVLHRQSGKVYVFLVLFLCAPSGLIMAFYANGGFWARLSFVIIAVLWWGFTYKAYTDIRKKKLQAHVAGMTLSYALTLSAITLRSYVFFLPGFIHLHAKEMYILVAWLSWIPNLLIAELINRKRKKRVL